MPLIILTGPPRSRKTELATVIRSKIGENSIIINEEWLKIDKIGLYSNAKKEKVQRGEILSAVERHLNQKDCIIVDSLNYIKGFRYQLTCIAKALQTPFVIVNVMCDLESSLNNLGDYELEEITNLYQRFEEPSIKNKWENPVINVVAHEVQEFDDTKLKQVLKGKINSKLSTEAKPLQEANYLYSIDKLIQDGLKTILDGQKDGRIKIKWAKASKEFVCNKKLSLIESRKLQLHFLKQVKAFKTRDLQTVADALVEYINTWSSS
jgi:protein KTI12